MGWNTADRNVPSAEMMIVNCVFVNSTVGVALLSYNDYDNYFSGCLFADCDVGILNQRGMAYVTNTRFERSSIADATVSGQPNSFRRVVSINSSQFVIQDCGRWQCFPQYGSGGGGSPTKIHSSYVTGWGVAGKALDAASLNMTRGPYQLVDTIFVNPVDSRSCAMGFGGDAGVLYAVALSNVSAVSGNGVDGCVLNPASTRKAKVYTVPAGLPAARAMLPSLGPDTMFFRSDSDWSVAGGGQPTSVFDLVRDFGADFSGSKDAAPALAACVKAAAAKGNGAECYIPAGTYILNATVDICGVDFSLGGTGWNSVLSPAPGMSAPLLAAGPGAGCDSSIFRPLSVCCPDAQPFPDTPYK